MRKFLVNFLLLNFHCFSVIVVVLVVVVGGKVMLLLFDPDPVGIVE